MPTTPAPPSGLRETGAAFWHAVHELVPPLRPDRAAVLALACRSLDVLDDLDAEFNRRGRPLTARGSFGQPVEHPLLGSIMRFESLLIRQVAFLRIPDPHTGETSRSAAARHAAQVRWSRPRRCDPITGEAAVSVAARRAARARWSRPRSSTSSRPGRRPGTMV